MVFKRFIKYGKRKARIVLFFLKGTWNVFIYAIFCRVCFFLDEKPKISLVVVGRNDNYGGDFKSRLKTILDWNSKLFSGEIIYVEWNPLPDKLLDSLWLTERYQNMRAYVVPHAIHEKYCSNPHMSMMEFFAKNVGIRRAKYDWICVINADILIGLDVRNGLHQLNKKFVYGTNRIDYRWSGRKINKFTFLDGRLMLRIINMCKKHNYIGDFLLAHKDAWFEAKGYDESLKDKRRGCDRRGLAQLLTFGIKPKCIGSHLHLDHPESTIHGIKKHQGGDFDRYRDLPYRNSADWGLINFGQRKISTRVWELEEI